MSVVRLALVGCGSIAKVHLQSCRACGGVVTALVDVRRKAATELLELLPPGEAEECKVFTDLSEALQYGCFDAVVIMVPHNLHLSFATSCLEAGKHVLLEKPLGHTVEACRELLATAERVDKVFMVGENSPFWPEVVKAKQLMDAGAIGEPYFVLAHHWESVASEDFAWPHENGHWRYDPSQVGGGILMDGSLHWIRPLRIWFGEVTEVVGIVGYPYKPSKGETLAHAILRFKGGKTASLHSHYMDVPMSPLPFFQIYGSKGQITIDGNFSGGLSLTSQEYPDGYNLGSQGGYFASFPPEMKLFMDSVTEGNSNKMASLSREAMSEVLVAKAIYKSVGSKKWEVPSVQNLISTEK